MGKKLFEQPHRRFNPLNGEWVLVSPQRLKRPWRGKRENEAFTYPLKYDPGCYLCPGNLRAGGVRNPSYNGVFVFDNDFAALLPDSEEQVFNKSELIQARGVRGLCRVLCYSPRHDLTMSRLDTGCIRDVVKAWAGEYRELGKKDFIRYVQIFENRGAIMGCSNPHPHGQIWATSMIPVEVQKEERAQKNYAINRNGACLLCDYLSLEIKSGERIICENGAWFALVPFWAKWPYEAMILPRRHISSLSDLTDTEMTSLAEILKKLTVRFDHLFDVSFPYTMGIHQAPTDGKAYPHWHIHFHFFPPLLRSASVQKFMVGFEMLATPQRDFTPEWAAETLRALSENNITTPKKTLKPETGETWKDD